MMLILFMVFSFLGAGTIARHFPERNGVTISTGKVKKYFL